ncbi:MAG: anaerobic sulfatase maturase [Anaerolineae bacterium]|nr:anaerobic sulfatase maturase [Anaerolineae bacterium]
MTLPFENRVAPPAFHVMTKPRGPICNLRCDYCYYIPKAKMYPESEFVMTDAVLDSFTRQYIQSQQVPEVTFGWQGGEPLLMGIEFFEKAVAYQKQYTPDGVRVINTLQTNGTLIDKAWAAFFHDNNFLIGLSLDGPQPMHDAFRVDAGGQPTWDRVTRGLHHLQDHEVEFNILCTVHSANAPHPEEVYKFFRDEAQAQFMQFIPIVRRDNDTGHQQGDNLTHHSVTGQQYGDFLIGIFDEWVRHDVGRVFVQIFDVALAAWVGQRPGLCVFEPTCGLGLAMEHNGDLYACDHYVEPNYKLGNIMETPLIEMVASEQQRAFGRAKLTELPEQCVNCEVRFICNGGCPKNRILVTEEGQPRLNHLCAGYKSFFMHVDQPMRMMVSELRQRRAPANVMVQINRAEEEMQKAFTAAGRNDPCPCGSGKKFKQCHGRGCRSATS